MRNLILSAAISFDGFIEGPNGEIDWITFGDEDGASDLMELVGEIDTVLYGRVSYEMWGNPEITVKSSDFEKKFYGAVAKMDRYVFSRTKSEFEGKPTVVNENVVELVNDLKKKPGKNIWLYGGSSLVTTFMNLDLVDELWLGVMPVILGQGKPLFSDVEHRHNMRLKEARPSPSGAIAVRYEMVRSV
jgi:dihydrofolate reductase